MYVCFGFLLCLIVTGYNTSSLNIKDISKVNDEIYLKLDEAAEKGLSLANQAKTFAEDVVRSQVIYSWIIQMLILLNNFQHMHFVLNVSYPPFFLVRKRH